MFQWRSCGGRGRPPPPSKNTPGTFCRALPLSSSSRFRSNGRLCFFFFSSERTVIGTDLRVAYKRLLISLNYVQHVSYINIYLKYKSILLLLDFGLFFIEDTKWRFKGGTRVYPSEGGGALPGFKYFCAKCITPSYFIIFIFFCGRSLLFKILKWMFNVLYSFFNCDFSF